MRFNDCATLHLKVAILLNSLLLYTLSGACLSFAREARVAPERGPLPALACWRITKSIGYSWLYSSVLHKQTATPVLRAADSLSALASLKSEVADSLCSSATSRHGVA